MYDLNLYVIIYVWHWYLHPPPPNNTMTTHSPNYTCRDACLWLFLLCGTSVPSGSALCWFYPFPICRRTFWHSNYRQSIIIEGVSMWQSASLIYQSIYRVQQLYSQVFYRSLIFPIFMYHWSPFEGLTNESRAEWLQSCHWIRIRKLSPHTYHFRFTCLLKNPINSFAIP